MPNLPKFALVALVFAAPTFGQSTEQLQPLQEVEVGERFSPAATSAPTLWFVELSSPPLVEGSSEVALAREESEFHGEAAAANARYSATRRFRVLWNGLVVSSTAEEASKLRALRSVQALYRVEQMRLEQAEDPAQIGSDLATALAMTGVDVAQSELGLTGAGIRVAVIDSGIDYDHPDLGGCFGSGCRVEGGFDLVGDEFNANAASPSFNPVRVPDPLPDDCDGHGTHVSGIIGANGTIKGVAPAVTFLAYRVFGCEGSSTADVVLEAMERAFADGAHVINMSLGAALQWPQYPTSQATNRLVRGGVVVVASIGNEGALGLYAAGAPGVGRDVIGVASVNNTHANLAAFTVSPGDTAVGYTAATGAPPPPLTWTFPLARTGTPTTLDDACAALEPGSLSGSVALVRRGTCAFALKAANVQAAGAIGAVIYNNEPGRVSPTVVGPVPIQIPVVAITQADGAMIDGLLEQGESTLTWTSLVISEPQATSGLISTFSSYGLAPDLSFKPDLAAPGGSVRSTMPVELGAFGNVSGTSQAAPHVAGTVALMLEAKPGVSPREVQARLQNTASPTLWLGNPALGFLDNVHRQGAGLIDVPRAIDSNVVVTPSNLALGEIEAGAVEHELRIRWTPGRHAGGGRGKGDEPVTYTLGHEPALATGASTFVPTFFASFASVEFSASEIQVGPRREGLGEAHVRVTITPPANPLSRLFGGYITLTPDDGGPALRVPYVGYNGDYQEIPALTPTPVGFPKLAKVEGDELVLQPDGAVYTLADEDFPVVLFHLDHPVRKFQLEVVDVHTGLSFNLAADESYLGRNSTPTAFFSFIWDGTTMRRAGGRSREVPDGTYRIELSVLKALGDAHNPAHVERWTSPDITLARP